MREREREEGGARAWSTWQTFKRLASLIRVDELARSIQVRVSRNPDLLCVSFRVAFSCQLSARAMIEIVAFASTSERTCIKHGDVTVRRHLTAAGRALERVKVTARRLFQVCVQNGGDVHFRRARTPMIIDCTFEHLPTTDR